MEEDVGTNHNVAAIIETGVARWDCLMSHSMYSRWEPVGQVSGFPVSAGVPTAQLGRSVVRF
jgi:hypothetical protein